MTKAHNIASFVLRFTQELWQDHQGEPHVRWRGHIQHVQGDEEDRFTDLAEAIAFMQRYLTELTFDTLSRGKEMSQEKVFQESFKLWGQFASTYADLMTRTFEQSIKQSEVFKERIDEAREQMLRAWQLPGQPDQKSILEAMQELQEQVQSLADRVKHLEEALQHKQEET
jgi:hypothetical protein